MDRVKISAEQAKSYRAAFDTFDKNGDGTIAAQEVGPLMTSIGQKVTEKEIISLIKEVDLTEHGSVEYDHFCQMMILKMEHNEQEAEMRAAFR